eukprot:TRINITY_DN17098_c1_g1_i1.p1 TRINITY_DN17098_c1_g1~~TRINITY_DN17098_c1_g1_i1.p1  ORF type:complete len:151 (+),score=40.23 TRINITY_DN17098_c1_g1_i1:182-634(+)
MMKVILIVAALAVAVIGFPTLYQGCELPTTGFAAHGAPTVGFGDDYSFSFTDMDGNAAESFSPGSTYMVTVSSAGLFRMTTIADSGSFMASDASGEPVCEGLRVNNNDVVADQTVTWMADEAANVTFGVNLAGGCANAYVQDFLFVEAAM